MLNISSSIVENTQRLVAAAIFLVVISISSFSCRTQINSRTIDSAQPEVGFTINPMSPNDTVQINQYVDDLKEGFWRKHYPNGQVKSEGHYVLGEKEGKHIEWESDGVLSLIGIYRNGKGNGHMQWYHGLGHLAAEGNMIDDQRDGDWIICDIEDNGFCIDAYFLDGQRSGVWKIKHDMESAKIWKEQTYREDRLVSERCWDKDGNTIPCTILIHGN